MHIYDTLFWMLMRVIACCTYYIHQLTFMNNELLSGSNVDHCRLSFLFTIFLTMFFTLINFYFIMKLRIKNNF